MELFLTSVSSLFDVQTVCWILFRPGGLSYEFHDILSHVSGVY
jgi:hypothetical protein